MNRLQSVFADVFDEPFEAVKTVADFREIPSWDSLKQIRMILYIENAFQTKLKGEEVVQVTCYSSLLKLLKLKGIDIIES